MQSFKIGDFKGMALSCGCTRAYVRNLVAGVHKGCSLAMAKKLVVASLLEGVVTEELDWIFPAISGNEAFLEYRNKGGMR